MVGNLSMVVTELWLIPLTPVVLTLHITDCMQPLQVLVYVDHHTIYGTSQKPFCMKFCQFNFRNSVIYTNVQSLCKNIIFFNLNAC